MANTAANILTYCKTKPYALHLYRQEWMADTVSVGGKIFALIGSHKDGRPILTLKTDPAKAPTVREAYKGIVIPGYYSNKQHRNSIYLDVPLDETILFGWIDDSYELILQSLTKKERAALGV